VEDLKMKYIFEGEVRGKDSELVGRLRYFLNVDNDTIARTLVEVMRNSLEESLLPYCGKDSVKITNSARLEDLE